MAEGTSSGGRKRKAPAASPSCPVPGAVVKQEPEEGLPFAHADLPVAVEAEAELPQPRVNISLYEPMLQCACFRPLKPPSFKCEAGHRLCGRCRGEGHCRRCGRDTASVPCGQEDLDEFLDAYIVPCPFVTYGCASNVAYHNAAAHRAACAYAPLPCGVAGCSFAASPPMLWDHLAAAHSWRMDKLPGYGKPLALRVPPEPARRLLAVEGDERRVFMLSVGELGGAAAFWAVSVACVRASGAAEAGPQYKCILWGQTPGHRVISELDKVASCAVPGGAAAREGTPPLVVPASSEEIDLRIRIDVVGPAPAALLAATQ